MAERQQVSARTVPAPRGEILDATRRVIAQSREMVRLEIAPREVRERAKLRRALQSLHIDESVIARALDSTEKYLTIPGRFLATDASTAMQIRGVKSFASLTRAYAASQSAQGIVGHVDANNSPVDGLELSLDSILRGIPGAGDHRP
jgi:cell division protein FtsI/penicillin-binding protein 2